eukprot:jgi/Mesen1/9256/ME000006S09255
MACSLAVASSSIAVASPATQLLSSASNNVSTSIRFAPLGSRVAISRRQVIQVSAKLDQQVAENAVTKLAEMFKDEKTQNGTATVMAGALFASLANVGSASAAQEVLQLADADARGLSLLVVLVPAIGWVLFNILQPALNQFNKMRGAKSFIGAMGLGAAASLLASPQADAVEEVVAQAAGVDARPISVFILIAAALGWVLFNIAGPALNQFDKMKNVKGVIGAAGLGAAASLLVAPHADAAQEFALLGAEASTDARPLILLVVLGPAIGWVLFNILKPALNQFDKMKSKKSVIGAMGLGAASLLAAPQSEAAQEIAQLATDYRPLVLALPVVAAAGWVLFNIAGPALNQVKKMQGKK